jgi:hypothetical protein
MRHFVKLVSEYIPKNNAHKQAQELVRSFDRQIVDDIGKASLIKKIERSVREINQSNPRCTPIVLSVWDVPSDEITTVVSIEGNFQLSIWEAKS